MEEETKMVTKEDLKDWFAENTRKEYAKELEDGIDTVIKNNALRGNANFHICTGKYTKDGSRETAFYGVWNTDKVSKENRKIVQEMVINKYREFGFDIEKTTVDCGWSNNYFALLFKDVDKVM